MHRGNHAPTASSQIHVGTCGKRREATSHCRITLPAMESVLFSTKWKHPGMTRESALFKSRTKPDHQPRSARNHPCRMYADSDSAQHAHASEQQA